ncbi:hypothetical protein DesfrDRAFT_3026 [Solidesulfovibrio fructosivorans JJ]]|uniref:DUF2726 domain-containing protein n=1 Tax=Solidesulfovibrio fructosivorans JJ] TaxID=596151 RepID=E1JZH8_SOLFR|nr:DUF2726 domain-containing protein [Solidesulfovibrio fructosivorans]EFL50225.1 hypothetical protein DesfrDRAFT_3026 [Solidesulfovibrio fructosivorans JJ]]
MDVRTVGIVVGLLVAAYLVGKFFWWRKGGEKREYYSLDFDFSVFKRKKVFTQNESKFFEQLEKLVGRRYHVLSMVRLADVLRIDNDKGNLKYADRGAYYAAFNRVSKMHLDFVVITRPGHYVACIIELDDSSHDGYPLKDRFKDEVLRTLDLPMVRIKAKPDGNYTPEYIREHLQGLL